MPGDVSPPMAITTDEPLFIEPGGMLGDAWEVYRFICSRCSVIHSPHRLQFSVGIGLPPAMVR